MQVMGNEQKSAMVIVGIDPGSLKTGFGVIEVVGNDIRHLNHGVILLADEAGFAERLLALSDSLQMILKKYAATHVVIEKIFMGKNADSAFKLGHARGIAMMEAARAGCETHEYATRVVKKSVAGSGAATKEQVQLALKTRLRLTQIVNFDASDALAMAIHHAVDWESRIRWVRSAETPSQVRASEGGEDSPLRSQKKRG